VSDQPPLAAEQFRRSAPDRLAEVAEEYLTTQYGGRGAELLLADYRISGLWPVLREGDTMAGSLTDRSLAARCFASQQPLVDRLAGGRSARAVVPLTVWGERLGVLAVDLTGEPDAVILEQLRSVADELALALTAADRSTDRYRRSRRRQRLTMAAEMQWDLLPGRCLALPGVLVAGQLEPAYAVSGDHFDWALSGNRLTITVLNGFGSGIGASLLTVLAVNAMRNARRSGGNLVEQAELASDAVFSQHGGRQYAATLLLELELDTGMVTAIDAGSPRALRARGRDVSVITLAQQLPLGMFADARYEVQRFQLEPGDRLFIVSDGVHAAAPGGRPSYGDRLLGTALRATRLQPAPEAVGSVMRGLRDYHSGEDLDDDAVIVCLDWNRDD
jgi:serine phosphatase RsbU (regulator of sigma subunit)